MCSQTNKNYLFHSSQRAQRVHGVRHNNAKTWIPLSMESNGRVMSVVANEPRDAFANSFPNWPLAEET